MTPTVDINPVQYESWYHTGRGQWIAGREWRLLTRLMPLEAGATLLDVGSGTGYFSRRFASAGLVVTGVEPDPAMREYASTSWAKIRYLDGDARALPFEASSFDYVSAITSLCFIDSPQQALMEMWRVCRRGILIGLLHRNSLLYLSRRNRGGYIGARWDTRKSVRQWLAQLSPAPARVRMDTAILLPSAGPVSQMAETALAPVVKFGGFLAVAITKPTRN